MGLKLVKKAITEEEKELEKALRERGIEPGITEYRPEFYAKTPPGVIKPRKEEKFALITGKAKAVLERFDDQMVALAELRQRIVDLQAKIREAEKEKEEIIEEIGEDVRQYRRFETLIEELSGVRGDIEQWENVAFQYKGKGWDILMAIERGIGLEGEKAIKSLYGKDPATILKMLIETGEVSEEQIRKVEERIDKLNKEIYDEYVKAIEEKTLELKEVYKVKFFPPAEKDIPKMSSEKKAGLREWISSFVNWLKGIWEKVKRWVGVLRDIRKDINNVVDKLEEVLEIAAREKSGSSIIEIIAPNVGRIGGEVVVGKDAEDMLWSMYEKIAEACDCEVEAIKILEKAAESYGYRSKRATGWEELPKGWTMESVRKFWDSLVGDVKHKVTKCMKLMEGKIDDPAAFCASVKDLVEGTTYWRGK